MAERYPHLRRAQREGGPYGRAHRGQRRAKKASSAFDILFVLVAVFIITWIATPTVQRTWQVMTRPSAETEAIEKSVYYRGCNEARDAGAAPIYRGSPGYRSGMDGDDDGVACE